MQISSLEKAEIETFMSKVQLSRRRRTLAVCIVGALILLGFAGTAVAIDGLSESEGTVEGY